MLNKNAINNYAYILQTAMYILRAVFGHAEAPLETKK